MWPNRYLRTAVRGLSAGVSVGVAAYLTCVGIAWRRYGRPKRPASHAEADPLLDRFMPSYEVAERHHIRVAAPVEITFAAATELDLSQSAIIRAIFRSRELILRAWPSGSAQPRTLLAQMKVLGWGVLAEIPGREIVMGAATQPWRADVVFRTLPPGQFADFHEPGYVKIAWTLRSDPIGSQESVARTETRVIATDRGARDKFRWYWSFFSPGIVLIRKISLGIVKRDAERRAAKRIA